MRRVSVLAASMVFLVAALSALWLMSRNPGPEILVTAEILPAAVAPEVQPVVRTAREEVAPADPDPSKGIIRARISLRGADRPLALPALRLRLYPWKAEMSESCLSLTASERVVNGTASFHDVPAHRYRAAFDALELGAMLIEEVVVCRGETTELDLRFEKASSIRLIFTCEGKPHARAAVDAELKLVPSPLSHAAAFICAGNHLYTDDPLRTYLKGSTDETGCFTVTGISPGAYWGSGTCGGVRWQSPYIVLDAGSEREIGIMLPREVLEGVVCTEDGTPVEGATISVKWLEETEHWKQHQSTETDREGRFSIHREELGEWQLTAGKKGFSSNRIDGACVAENPDPVKLTVILTWVGLASIPVRIEKTEGGPWIEKSITFGRNGGGASTVAKADPSVPGLYLLDGLDIRQNVLLTPYLENTVFAPRNVKMDLAAGINEEIRFVVFPRPKIRGRVVDEAGRPFGGAWLRVLKPEFARRLRSVASVKEMAREQCVESGPDGSFTIETGEEGEVVVSAGWVSGGRALVGSSANVALQPGKTADAGDVVLHEEKIDKKEVPAAITILLLSGNDGSRLRGRHISIDVSDKDGHCVFNHFLASDGSGKIRFDFHGQEEAKYCLKLATWGFANCWLAAFSPVRGKENEYECTLEPAPYSLNGLVSASTFVKLESVHVLASGPNGRAGARTGSDGAFTLRFLPAGKYTLTFSHPEYLKLSMPVDWIPGNGGTQDEPDAANGRTIRSDDLLEVTLKRGASILGRFEYEDGEPYNFGGTVYAVPESEYAQFERSGYLTYRYRGQSARTARGKFRISGLPGGTYKIFLDHLNKGKEPVITVREGETGGPIIVAFPRHTGPGPKKYEISFRVLFPDGTPAAGSSIWSGNGLFSQQRLGVADAAGCWSKECTEGRKLQIFASRTGCAPSEALRIDPARVTQAVELRLRRPASVSGHVTAAPDTDVSKLWVSLAPANSSIASEVRNARYYMKPEYFHLSFAGVDPSARFTLTDLPPGTYHVFPVILDSRNKDAGSVACAAAKTVELEEGASVVAELDLTRTGAFSVRATLGRGETRFGSPSFSWWLAEDGSGPLPPSMFRQNLSIGERCWIIAAPGLFSASLVFRRVESPRVLETLWIIRDEVTVSAGRDTEIDFVHEPGSCGSLQAKILLPNVGTDTHYSLLLSRPGVRALGARDPPSGRVTLLEVPEGAYRVRLVRWPDRAITELGETRISRGSTTDLGTIQLPD